MNHQLTFHIDRGRSNYFTNHESSRAGELKNR